jgi:hypothetical protein
VNKKLGDGRSGGDCCVNTEAKIFREKENITFTTKFRKETEES